MTDDTQSDDETPKAPDRTGEESLDKPDDLIGHHDWDFDVPFETDWRDPVDRVYTPDDLEEIDFSYDDIGDPGEAPFARGIDKQMYRRALWNFDLYAGFGTAEAANERYRYLIDHGADGVNIALDLPTQIGLDSDDPLARGEVGQVGTAMDSLRDVEAAFEDIDIRDKVLFTVGNGIGPVTTSWFVTLAEQRGLDPDEYKIHLQNDPLKEFTGRGTQFLPMEAHMRLSLDAVEYCAEKNIHWDPIGITGSHFRWAGGNAKHELTFALANAMEFIDRAQERDFDFVKFLRGLNEFHLTTGIQVMEEAAKFRAARILWSRLLEKEYGVTDNEARKLGISLYTTGFNLTENEPVNNVVRIAYETLSAALGGVQYLGTLSFDEALSTPSRSAVKIAIRTNQILAYETNISYTVDPLAGSYYVETLTNDLVEDVWEHLQQIKERGGGIQAYEDGYYEQEVLSESVKRERELSEQKRISVGRNAFRGEEDADDELDFDVFQIDPDTEEKQKQRLADVKEERDDDLVEERLEDLRDVAESDKNVVPATKRASEAYATIGEICNVFRDVFGEYESDPVYFG